MHAQADFFLHIALNGGDQDIACHNSVLGGKAVCEVVGVEHLGIGGEFLVAGPDHDLHLVAADEIKEVACIAMLHGCGTHFLSGLFEGFHTGAKSLKDTTEEVNMAREFMSDEMVDEEIIRLQGSYHVKLARREEAIRNRKRNYMYQLRMYEKKGKALEAQGITLEELEEFAGALYECE